ncbi:MAG: type II secretion system protein [Planctomycetota bacterium]
MRRAASSGFSLIELLVVIAVVAILAGLLLVALAGSRGAGERARCLANLRSIGTAIETYRGQHDGVLPVAPAMPRFRDDEPGLVGLLAPHLTSTMPRVGEGGDFVTAEPWLCPADSGVAPKWGVSYEYEIAAFVVALSMDQTPNLWRRAARMIEDDPSLPLVADASAGLRTSSGDPSAWHERAAGSARNAVFADGRVDWMD